MGWTKGKLRGDPKPQYFCLNCGKEIPFKGYTFTHKYCDNQCQGELKAKQAMEKFRPSYEEGKDIGRPRQRKFLTEERGYKCEGCGISEWNGQPITLYVQTVIARQTHSQEQIGEKVAGAKD